MAGLQDLKAALTESVSASAINKQSESVLNFSDERKPVKEKRTDTTVSTNNINTLFDYYLYVCSSFCRMNGQLLTDGQIAVKSNLPTDMRTVCLDEMLFISKSFGKMLVLLILDYSGARKLFADAIAIECDLAKVSYDDRQMQREKFGFPDFDFDYYTVSLGTSWYVSDMEMQFASQMADSIKSMDKSITNIVDDKFLTFTQTDADDIGVILSNPIYLLSAFYHNGMFVERVKRLCNSLEQFAK